MGVLRSAAIVMLGALVGPATAQVVAPPLSATVVNFDDVEAPSSLPAPGPLTTEYSNLGITFGGFGLNGGARTQFFGSVNSTAVSPPNVLYFIGIGTMGNGGLQMSPEFLSFDPPINSLQFDLTTLGFDCEGTMAVTAQGFAPGGALVAEQTVVIPIDGITLALDFPSPVTNVTITSTQTCGTMLFRGVELFTIDNVAFTPAATGVTSNCAGQQIDAAAKKAKAKTKCYSKAVANGAPVDSQCLQKATNDFSAGFAKALNKFDCITGADVSSVEAIVDQLVADVNTEVNGNAPGPDICASKKIAEAGKKFGQVAKCYATSAKKGTAPADACVQKAADQFVRALKKCSTAEQSMPLEMIVDSAARAISRAVALPSTTTTTTTTTSTTSTTERPALGPHYTFTSAAGSANCAISPSSDPPTPLAPLSGEIDSDTEGTKIADLGQACLYIGGGAGFVAPSQLPENASTIFNTPDLQTLLASFGTSERDCTKGPGTSTHCLNNSAVACTSDADCFLDGACQPDANCFFGPPVPVNGFPASCVINTFAADASGMINLAASSATLNVQLASRVFISTLNPTACPQCIDNACTFGQTPGGFCQTNNVNLTTLDCLPGEGTYIATLPINLSPLTTNETVSTAPDGNFCPDQVTPGAFGQPDVKVIRQQGSINIATGEATLVSNFCIPSTGSPSLDNIANLPGPGTLSLPGVTVFSSPSGAFLD